MLDICESDPNMPFPENEMQIRLAGHIAVLAGEIGERNIWHFDKLSAAADYILAEWQATGLDGRRLEYQSRGIGVANLETEFAGRTHPHEIVIVGAHYDSVFGSPGANDNASGVAALLEIGRLLSGAELSRTVRLVAFVNEEPPFFMRDDMGSYIYARRCRRNNENIVAMLSLETIGCYDDMPGSQRYPFPLGLLYPDTANFIGFVGNLNSRKLVKKVLASFRRHMSFPAQGVAAPGWMTGIGWSDHWSFWQAGYPALMVTDTALFRSDSYHTETDTPEKIDYPRLTSVVAGLNRVIEEMGTSSGTSF